MSILFVLLTFLVILGITYFRRNQVPQPAVQLPQFDNAAVPEIMQIAGVEVPQKYAFHPGHMWAHDEGRQNARVGIDAFAANLFGPIDSIEVAELNRWVRQGQRLCTIKHGGQSVDLLSPVEGVVVSLNHEVLQNPNLAIDDPYKNGWVCVIKAPELSTNTRNLLHSSVIPAWMQNDTRLLAGMIQQLNPALAQDGGLPIKGLFFRLDPSTRQKVAKDFFLT
jgi:glycine cleavage system H lipoate-binding protein